MKKRVAVLGLGVSGLAGALFLKKKGFHVFVSDVQISDATEKRSQILEKEDIPFELGRHCLETLKQYDWALISPGIPPSSEVYQYLIKNQIPVMSEVEAASWFSPGEVIAVTGTSGKTTVTTLIGRILKANGIDSLTCGNIGNPWISEIERITPQTKIILELSSFQLLHTYSLRPHIGILLNIGLNHLDWHPTMEDYVAAKLRLFQNQKSRDIAFIRENDRKKFFPDFRFAGKVQFWEAGEGENSNETLLHEITRSMRLDPKKTQQVLSQFEGLEHRLEKIGEINGIQFVNDSKSTTLEAVAWALERFGDKKVILLAGGHAKANDFRSLRDLLAQKVKQAVIYGEAQELLFSQWEGAAPLKKAKDLKEAFQIALKVAEPGDALLLSPACASFDQFNNYKERGQLFKKLVMEFRHEPAPLS